MSWINPKTDWVPGDGIMAGDLNRIEGNTRWLRERMFHYSGLLSVQSTTGQNNVTMFEALVVLPKNHTVSVDPFSCTSSHTGYTIEAQVYTEGILVDTVEVVPAFAAELETIRSATLASAHDADGLRYCRIRFVGRRVATGGAYVTLFYHANIVVEPVA